MIGTFFLRVIRIFGGKALVLFLFAVPAGHAADTILVNGKIITVDDRFTIAEALAIEGQRIVAVGKNDEIRKRGAGARVIDLQGHTVIPGLIDNHAHFIRVAEKWHFEMRLDGVTSRKEALRMVQKRVARTKPGDWIVTLGGWSEEQFIDDPRGFTLEELESIYRFLLEVDHGLKSGKYAKPELALDLLVASLAA